MLDFISTRTNTDPESAGCAKLLAAIVADSIRGAGLKPYPMEFKTSKNIDINSEGHDPRLSVWFLFDDKSNCRKFCNLIGFNLDQIRDALLSTKNIIFTTSFNETHRQYVQLRYEWYLLEKKELERDGLTFKFSPVKNNTVLKVKTQSDEVVKPTGFVSVWGYADNFEKESS